MGPRPNGRGKQWTATIQYHADKRQWGRGQTAAESSGRPTNRSACHCVNGAAAKRPRKGLAESRRGSAGAGVNGAAAKRPRKVTKAESPFSRPLRVNGAAAKRPRKVVAPLAFAGPLGASMGPRPNGRGKLHFQGRPPCLQCASMGPRPNGRGKAAPRACAHCGRARQWGRGQTAAERRRLLGRRPPRARRQWGRGQTAAESRRPLGRRVRT